MRILYVAKHNSGGNDDEGAIAHAFTQLGHEVERIHEDRAKGIYCDDTVKFDFCLFHKWQDLFTMKELASKMPLVCWYFDLVEYPDPTLVARNMQRFEYMERLLGITRAIFATDGDWAERNGQFHLPQGADERFVGIDNVTSKYPVVLITASRKGGQGRDAFFTEMQNFGTTSGHVVEFHYRGLHGQVLRQAIANAKVCVAPSHPVTDRYWSNRVYNTLGFGGILLHPWSLGLAEIFLHNDHLFYYNDPAEMHDHIANILKMSYEDQIRVRMNGLREIKRRHLYRHRCERMIQCLSQS